MTRGLMSRTSNIKKSLIVAPQPQSFRFCSHVEESVNAVGTLSARTAKAILDKERGQVLPTHPPTATTNAIAGGQRL